MHWLAALFLIFSLGFQRLAPAAQETYQIIDDGTTAVFGQQINFRARIQPVAELKEMVVFITPAGQPTVWQEMTVDEQGLGLQIIDTRQLALPPFSTVEYRFQASLKDGKLVTSPLYTLEYGDTRFTWNSETRGDVKVHWYSDDPALGQEILNVAEQGIQQAQQLLPVDPPAPLHIYAYDTAQELQDALSLTGQTWVAGHASPELGMILISIPSGPEKKLELQRQIPHEIMHLIQYQQIGDDFEKQPVWLIEGMASLAELYPNPEYNRVLVETVRAGNLLPMGTLCKRFPAEASGAFLSYAQSESFVRFLHSTYGATALRDLIARYEDGMGCEEGAAAAFGVSFSQLEYRWKQEALGFNPGALALRRLAPYLLLGLLVVVPAAVTLLPLRSRRRTESAT